MLVVVVIIFMLSWLPLYAIFIRIKLGSDQMEPWEIGLLAYATPIAQWLGASNSCINPVLYAYFNQKYRRGFKAIIKSRSCCGTIRTTAADYEPRYVTSEGNTAAWFARSRRENSARRSAPTAFAHHQAAITAATAESGTSIDRNMCTHVAVTAVVATANSRRNRPEDHHILQTLPNGAVVNTQDSIELNAIHRKWKSQVL